MTRSRRMHLRRFSQRQKVTLLVLGLIILAVMIFGRNLIQQDGENETPELIANEELLILGTKENIDGLKDGEVYTDRGIYTVEEVIDWEPYLYQSVQAVVEDSKILHINNLLQREVKLENCLIIENTERNITIFSEGWLVELPCSYIDTKFTNEIVDIYLANGNVTKISMKKEHIFGKILSIRSDKIELEGYGTIPISDKFRFYETYGGYQEKDLYGLIVGYEQAKLVVAEGEICAAILDAPISMNRIRVLLKTTDFKDTIHETVQLKAYGNYEISYGSKQEILEDAQTLELNRFSDLLEESRVILKPQSDDARIEISNIERNYGIPQYAGIIEVVKDSAGLVIINDVDLETYLYSVVPSEMPASYEIEALKAQAVCARSYAYGQILLNGYASYGAHVDDSVSYQVYNNLETRERVIQAVNETAGQVLKFGESVATTYYFSTSCGYTTNETIWKNGSAKNSYISGKLLNDSREKLNLCEEETFRAFILNEEYETYDSGEAWYRWDMTVPAEHITETIGKTKDIGKVTDIVVTERNEGGAVQKVEVFGKKDTVEIVYEHAIRVALNGKGETIHRTYGKDAMGGNMLPSGFFVIDKIEEDGDLIGFRFRGGGFGHGAGMSQNGANHMAEAGKNYEEILDLFYEGAQLSYI